MAKLNSIRKIIYSAAISIGLLSASMFATASTSTLSSITNAPFDNSNPEKLIPTGNENGLSPTQTYHEYNTVGSPERNPVPWIIDGNSQSKPSAYQTNKWYTDLMFYAKQRGNLFDDFRAAQSPFNLRVLDTAIKNAPDSYTDLPGLMITAAKKPFLTVGITKPSPLGISQDMYPQTLMVDTDVDLAFSIPASMALDSSYAIQRKILVDSKHNQPTTDQLSFTTEWTVTKAGHTDASMTAPIVRGSPYMTMLYNNMPITLSGRNIWAIAADGGTAESLPDKPLDKPYSVTGTTFRLVTSSVDNALCTQKSFKDAQGNSICSPVLYNVYVLYASKPITLTFHGTTPGDMPPPKLLFHQLSDTKPFTGVLRLAYAGSLAYGAAMSQPESTTKAILDGTSTLAGMAEIKQHEQILNTYANVYPVGADVSYAQSNYAKAEVIFNWKTQHFNQELYNNGKAIGHNPNSQLLMTAFAATQIKNMQLEAHSKIVNDLSFETIRGPMLGVLGHKWIQTIHLPFNGSSKALWYGNKNLQNATPEYIERLKSVLQQDIALLATDPQKSGNSLDTANAANDSYAFGKKVARLARLALIAEELGDQAAAQKIAANIESALDKWFPAQVPSNDPHGMKQNYFKYDDKFGGVITARAAANPSNCPQDQCGYNLDFYNGMYTDHHFHYGYFLYAAAAAAKIDPKWGAAHQQEINLLARDIANPSTHDAYFPELRMFDMFEGHGFANGLGPGASGRNQESSSEAVNAWYGLALWGDVNKNPEMKALGLILAAQEIQATQAWAQIVPDKSVYKDYSVKAEADIYNKSGRDIAMKDDGITGINWSLKVDHSTFFGNKSAFVLGIHMMPYTPITAELISKEWLAANQDVLKATIANLSQQIDLYNDPNAIITNYPKEMLDPNVSEDGWKGYWNGFQSGPNVAYQWQLIVQPILALSGNDTGLYNDLFTVYPDKIEAVNQAFKKAAAPSANSQVSEVCPEGATNSDACNIFVKASTPYGSYWQPVGTPFAYVDYRGLDSGMTYTNLVWWLATHSQSPLPPAREKFYVPNVTVSVDKNDLTANWTVVHDYKDADVSYNVSLYNTAQTEPVQTKIVSGSAPLSITFSNLPDGKYKVRVTPSDSKANKVEEPGYTDSQEIAVESTPTPPPNKGVRYLLVPAATGAKPDSQFQVTVGEGAVEVSSPQDPVPPGAKVLAVTAESDKPANVLVKVTNAANAQQNASCLLNLSTQRWQRAGQQPDGNDCDNFPMNGTVDTKAAYTVIGVSTPNKNPTPPANEKFYVSGVTANAVKNTLAANWTVVDSYPDAQPTQYKVSLYSSKQNTFIDERIVANTSVEFVNLADGVYKVRVEPLADSKGNKPQPAFAESTEVIISSGVVGGYYLFIPNFHADIQKADTVQISGGAEIVNPSTPLPPGAVIAAVTASSDNPVIVSITNTQTGKTAACTLLMSTKSWSINADERVKPGCAYLPHSGGSAGTLSAPTAIGVSSPQ